MQQQTEREKVREFLLSLSPSELTRFALLFEMDLHFAPATDWSDKTGDGTLKRSPGVMAYTATNKQ